MMKNVEPEKKVTIGCLSIAALFFVLLGLFLHNEEQHSKQEKVKQEEVWPISPATTAPVIQAESVRHKKKIAPPIFALTDDEDNDDEDDDDYDPYDDPDFDDLFPGEEHEEFFLGNEGDPELYDEP